MNKHLQEKVVKMQEQVEGYAKREVEVEE